ncbi:MAG: hypothetical protein ACPGOV_14380 [Magnetovibrionaceae bacterium]
MNRLGAFLALGLMAGASACAPWPVYEGGGWAEQTPVMEPDVFHRTSTVRRNSDRLTCIKAALQRLTDEGVGLVYPAALHAANRQWDRAARAHAGGLEGPAAQDIRLALHMMQGLDARWQDVQPTLGIFPVSQTPVQEDCT